MLAVTFPSSESQSSVKTSRHPNTSEIQIKAETAEKKITTCYSYLQYNLRSIMGDT